MDPDPLQIAGMLVHGRLRIGKAVGEGAFGVVYEGTHLELDRPVAIKCLKVPEGLTSEEDRDAFVGRFRHEAQKPLQLGDEGKAFVRVLDVAAFAMPSGLWVPFIVLEWIEGQSLDAFAAAWRGNHGKPMGVDEVIEQLDSLVTTLGAAHRRGLVHGDLSPKNVLLGGTWPRLLDFGVAKAFEEEQSSQASRPPLHLFFFTPSHGAPEQFDRSLGATGPWTDVFALALLLVELLSGSPALRGKTPGELCVSATLPARPTPRARGAQVSDAVEAVFARALAVAPGERYPDAGAFWAALKEALVAPVVAPAAPVAPAASAAAPPVEPFARAPSAGANDVPQGAARAAAPPAPVGTRLSSTAIVLALASAVVLGGAAVVFFVASSRGKTEASSQPSSAAPAPTAPSTQGTIQVPPIRMPPLGSSTPAPSPAQPVACTFGVGVRVTVTREPAPAEWADLPAPRRFPSVNVGYTDTVQTIEGTFFSPSRAPHLLLPCAIAKKAEASTP